MTESSRIFFGAAIQGAVDRSKRALVNKTIIEMIKSSGFSVISEHTTGLDFDDTAAKLEKTIGPLPPIGIERTVFIRNKMIQFIESDIIAAVFEVSVPSLGTGIEIAHACMRPRMSLPGIPVIALYQNGFWPNNLSAMVSGISHDKVPHFTLIKYDTPDDIARRLKPILHKLSNGTPAGSSNDMVPAHGHVIAKKCEHCGHHEIGVEKESGEFVALKPGMTVKIA